MSLKAWTAKVTKQGVSNAAAYSDVVELNWAETIVPAVSVAMSATGYTTVATLQHTYDNTATGDATTWTWWPNANATNANAATEVVYTNPVTALRMALSSGSNNTWTMWVVAGGR